MILQPTVKEAACWPEKFGAALATALVVLVPGVVGLATGSLLLFPSLAPSALIQAHTPEHPSARLYNVIVSHFGALLCAYLAVALFGLTQAPSVFELKSLSPARVGAAVLAVFLGTLLELVLRASHPPAASTALLVALGSLKPTVRDTTAVVVGVLIVGFAGEAVRRLRLRGRRYEGHV